jgi:hypothetical protein
MEYLEHVCPKILLIVCLKFKIAWKICIFTYQVWSKYGISIDHSGSNFSSLLSLLKLCLP